LKDYVTAATIDRTNCDFGVEGAEKFPDAPQDLATSSIGLDNANFGIVGAEVLSFA